ncbi:uncharacterized protein [Nicotiana tomentosiformis]|uniref:uncharacterized protein n=1 Tax=Nicotiana tomentosiformis TaxID=4098 RepID=UPI00388C8694
MEVYIDDMLVKSAQAGDHFQHLSDTFQILRKYNMKLNPKKCAFGIASVLKKQNQFEWTDEQALKDLKSYLSNPPLLAKPKDGERLLIYLVVSEVAVLADFVADFSTNLVPKEEKELHVFTGSNLGTWILFTDGSSNVKGAGSGIVLITPSGEAIRQTITCCPITNNEAECEAMIAGLELARELGIEHIVIKSDSQLVVNQMQGTYIANKAQMEENAKADALANLVSVTEITKAENAIVIHLFHSGLDKNKNEKSQVRQKAARYCLICGNLYRKMFGGPLARYLGPSQTEYVMREAHKGNCGNHAGGEDHW